MLLFKEWQYNNNNSMPQPTKLFNSKCCNNISNSSNNNNTSFNNYSLRSIMDIWDTMLNNNSNKQITRYT